MNKALTALLVLALLLAAGATGYTVKEYQTITKTITKTITVTEHVYTSTRTIVTTTLTYLKLGEVRGRVLYNETLIDYKKGTIIHVNFTVKGPCRLRVMWESEYPLSAYVMSLNEYKSNHGILGFHPVYYKYKLEGTAVNRTIPLRWPDTYYLVVYIEPQAMGIPRTFRIYYIQAAIEPLR